MIEFVFDTVATVTSGVVGGVVVLFATKFLR